MGSTAQDGSPQDETDAIAACQRGDRDAYELIVRRYAARAIGVARSILKDAALADDVAQEAFVRAFKAIRRFKLDQPFYPWLYRIVKNCCLSTIKKRKRHAAASLDAEDAPPVAGPVSDPTDGIARRELRATIDVAMGRLSDAHREILHLAHFEELSYKEIAACLAIPIGTVMSRLWAARKALKKALAPMVTGHE